MPYFVQGLRVEVYEAAVLRLAMLGYTVTEQDKAGLEYIIAKSENELLGSINHQELPMGLRFTLADMAAGGFLFEKKAAGVLEGFDFSAQAKSISEGDISITFDTASSPEARFDAVLARLMHPSESVLAKYRRFAW